MRSFTIPKTCNFTDQKAVRIWCAEITGLDQKFIFSRKFLIPFRETENEIIFHVKDNIPHHFKDSFGIDHYFILPSNATGELKKKKLTINEAKMWIVRQPQNLNKEETTQKLDKIGFIFKRTINACNVPG